MRMTRTTTDLPITPASAGVFDGGWVEIARACLPHEALLAAALLQGIPATTFDTDSHVMMPDRAVAFGGVRVMVPAGQQTAAAQLLDAVPQSRTRRRPVRVLLQIVTTRIWSAPPVPSGLFVRRPDPYRSAGA